MNILDFQKHFLVAIDSNDLLAEMAQDIIPIGDLTVAQTVEIYQKDYNARLSEVLGELYETIWMIVGDDEFQSLCQGYIKEHPSSVANLSQCGEEFPAFIRKQQISKEFPFLYDVATFEQNYWRVFHSEAPVGPPNWPNEGALQADLRIELGVDTILNDSAYRCMDLFFHRTQSADTYRGEIHQPQFTILFKEAASESVKMLELTRVQFELLDSLQEQNLEEAISSLELLIDTTQDTLSEIQDLFVKLRQSGVPLKIR